MKNFIFLSILLFSISVFAQTGPGGVGSTDGSSALKIWYKPDNGISTTGTSVDSLINSAGVTDHNMAASGTNRPTLLTSSLNGYDVLSFDGNDYMQITGSLSASNFISNQASSFLVSNRISTTASWPYATFPHQTNRFSCHVTWTSGAVYFDIGSCCGNSARLQVNGLTGLGAYSFWTYNALSSSGKDLYRNGGFLQNKASVSSYTSYATQSFRIGETFNGNIPELIIFNEKVNSAQQIIIENYISAKFNIANAGTDVYTQDDAINGDYDHEVAGIGRVDASNLHNDAQGSGVIRILNPTNLGDDEYLIWGHDNGDLLFTNTTDKPASMTSRLDRVWRVNEANSSGTSVDVGGIDFRVDFSGYGCFDASTLSLVIDTDNDGLFSDETAITGATNIGGNIYEFSGVTGIANNLRFTIGNTARDIVWDGSTYSGGSGTGSAPGASDGSNRLIIEGTGAIISTAGAVNDVLVHASADLTINTSIALTINGCIINNNSITVENSGSLIQTHSGTNINSGNGLYTIKRTGGNAANAYNIWSSPVQSSNIISTFGSINPCDVFVFDEGIQYWNHDYTAGYTTTCGTTAVTFTAADVITGGDGIMDVSRGYFIPGNATSTRVYTGEVNDGDLTYPIVTTNLGNKPNWNDDDWNLVGNPYPSAISASSFWNLNATINGNITDAIYYWDDNGTGSGYNPTSDYASWNLSGGVSSGNTATIPNGNISTGQGFWVVAANSANLDFNNSMRADTSSNDQFFKTEDLNDNHNIWIGIRTPSNLQNNILVGYNKNCSDGYDPSYDAQKFIGQSHINLSSRIADRDYAIQSIAPPQIDTEKRISLSVSTDESGIHTFYQYKMQNISDNMEILLLDNTTGTSHKLSNGNYQVFLDDTSDYNSRFELVFKNQIGLSDNANSPLGVEDSKNTSYSIIRSTNGYTLTNAKGIYGDIQIVDISGKLIWSNSNVSGATTIEIDLSQVSSGVYFLNVISNDSNSQYRQKLVQP